MGYRYNPISGELDLIGLTDIPSEYVSQIDTDAGSAIAVAHIINLIGTAVQGISSAGAGNTVTLTISNASETQKGVLETSTNAESITGTATNVAVVPSSLKAKLGAQTQYGLPIGASDSLAINWTSAPTNGQILIGSTGNTPILSLLSAGQGITITNAAGSITIATTGLPTPITCAVGDMIYGSAIDVYSNLTFDATATRYLSNTGGGATIPAWSQIDLSNGVTGVLTVPNGGTGASSITDHAFIVGSGVAAVTEIGPLGSGEILIGSVGADPVAGHLTSTGLTLDITEGAGTLNIDTNPSLQIDTGFTSWDAAGPYFDDTTLGEFDILVAGTGYIHNVLVSWTAPQTVNGMTAGNTYFIYIDSTGTIGKTDTRTDALFEDNIVLFECMRDSTPVTNNQITVKENHPSDYSVQVSNYQHDVINTVIENVNNGADIVLNGTQKIQINGADVLADHGLITAIPDSAGVGVTWNKMYTTAADKWAIYDTNDTFLGVYNNAGTPTAIGVGKYALYTLYVSKDNLNSTTPTYYAVMDNAEYNNAAAANAAISAGSNAQQSGELKALELCQLGYVIFGQVADAITTVLISKTTLRASMSSSGTNVASLVTTDVTNFDGILSAADTNVQAALDTIDDFGKDLTDHCVVVGNGNGNPLGVIGAGTTGELLGGVTGADPDFISSSDGDFAFTTATAATDRTLTISNTDNTAANSAAHLQVTVGGTTSEGDPYTNYLVIGGGTFSVGIDNSIAGDPFKITASASPSAGTDLFTMSSAGVITLANDLDISEGGTGVSTLTSHGILMGNGAIDIQATAEPTDGQILIGKTGDFPQLATISAGAGITVSNGAGTISISGYGGGKGWEKVSTATKTMEENYTYATDRAGGVTLTLPASSTEGSIIEIVGIQGLWSVAQPAGKTIYFGDTNTTLGITGSLTATNAGDCIVLRCIVANTDWRCTTVVGNITVI